MELGKRKKIKAIIFDMNGVLALGIELHKGSKSANSFHLAISKKLGISLDTWFDAIDTAYAKSIEGKISNSEVGQTVSKNLQIPQKKLESIIIKEYKKIFHQNKDLYRYAFKKKEEGYKIAILSDQWYFSEKAIFDKKLLKKFDVVISSNDVGIRKPNPEIYKLALKKLRLGASETIFIDNRKWNLKPAKKLGMKTVLFKNNEQTIKEVEKFLK